MLVETELRLSCRAPGDLELAVAQVCKQLQTHAGELKLKLDAAGATVEYAAANASTIKGFAAAIREELSSIKSACESLQVDSDLALVKAEACRQAAVKASSALPFLSSSGGQRASDNGARDLSRDLEAEKRRSHQMEAQIVQLKEETLKMQHYTERKEQELQSTLGTLKELWDKHEVSSSELERLRQSAGSTVLGQVGSSGQMPSPPPFDRGSNNRRPSKSIGGMTPNAKTQLSTFKVASLEEQMTRLQRRCGAAEERAERAEAELQESCREGGEGVVERMAAKLKQRDMEIQSALDKVDDLQWLQAKHKALVEEFEKTKASEASLLNQLSIALEQGKGQQQQHGPTPDKTPSFSTMSHLGGSHRFPQDQNPPLTGFSSMSRLSVQHPGSPITSSTTRIALLDRNRHSLAGNGLGSDSPPKTTLLSLPSPSVQINRMRGHGSSPGEPNMGEASRTGSLPHMETLPQGSPPQGGGSSQLLSRLQQDPRKELSALASTLPTGSSTSLKRLQVSGAPRVHSSLLGKLAPSYTNNLFGPPPELELALASLQTSLCKINGLSAARETTSSAEVVALFKERVKASRSPDETDALCEASSIPSLDPLLRTMAATSEEYVNSLLTFASTFTAYTSEAASPSSADSSAISLRSLLASSLSLQQSPRLFADVTAMASACISNGLKPQGTSRALPSPCRHLLSNLRSCALALDSTLMEHLGAIIASLRASDASGSCCQAATSFKLVNQELKGLMLGLTQCIRSVQDLGLQANAALPVDTSVKRLEAPRLHEIDTIANLTAGLEALSASFDTVFTQPKVSSNLGPQPTEPSFHPAAFAPLMNGYLLVIGQIIKSWTLSYGEVWDVARAHAAYAAQELRRQAELKAPQHASKKSALVLSMTEAGDEGAGDDEDDQETAKMEEVWRKKVRRGSGSGRKAVTWKPLSEEENAGLEEKLAFTREALSKCEVALGDCEEKLSVVTQESETYRTKMEEFGASLSLQRLTNHQRALASSLLDGDRGTPGKNSNSSLRASTSSITMSSVTKLPPAGSIGNTNDKKSLMSAMSSILSFKRK